MADVRKELSTESLIPRSIGKTILVDLFNAKQFTEQHIYHLSLASPQSFSIPQPEGHRRGGVVGHCIGA